MRSIDGVDDRGMRMLPRDAAQTLSPGAGHYTSYVGPPEQYDLMGAMQFRLLTTLGLRDHHTVLDFGCGSLRVGRLLIPYLREGGYFGLDPNRWLIEDGIDRELGRSIIALKRPTFLYHADFSVAEFGRSFDFILAHSIFSHAGRDAIAKCLGSFRSRLEPSGLILATFVQPHQLDGTEEFQGNGWVYPASVTYRLETVLRLIDDAGLAGRPLPWFHPRQTWFAMAHSRDLLPSESDDAHLTGVALDRPESSSGTG